MRPRTTVAVGARVLTQVRRDRRTLALLLVMPCVLMALLAWVFADAPGATFDRIAPGLLALFPFTVMFLVTSVTTLRERTSGTLERLLSMPVGRLDLILGYALAFGVIACAQAALAVALSVGPLGLDVAGNVWMLGAIAVVDALLGTALGLFVSAFARTEFQAVQFLPALVIPQMLLCGLLLARDQLPRTLELVSNVLPLSYAVDAMTGVALGDSTSGSVQDLAVVAAFAVAFVALGALTLRRRTD